MHRRPSLSPDQATTLLDFLDEDRRDDFIMHQIEVDPEEDAQLTVEEIVEQLREIANS